MPGHFRHKMSSLQYPKPSKTERPQYRSVLDRCSGVEQARGHQENTLCSGLAPLWLHLAGRQSQAMRCWSYSSAWEEGSRRNRGLQFWILRSFSSILSHGTTGLKPGMLCQNQNTYPCHWVWSGLLVTAGPVGQLRAVNLLAGHVCSGLLCWWPQLKA